MNKEGHIVQRMAAENVRRMQAVTQVFETESGLQAQSVKRTTASFKGLNAQQQLVAERMRATNMVMQTQSKQIVNWGKNTQWAGRQMMVGLSLPLIMFGGAAAIQAKKVDEELTKIAKVYGDIGEKVDKEKVKADMRVLGQDMAKELGMGMESSLDIAGQIAATGKTGKELETLTKEVGRLSVLGDTDVNESQKALLALTSAFGIATEDLGTNVNFLNMVENQTSASLQDLVEGIPRAGPVVEALGGDVKDLAIYMTAMREGGIAAGEGANALKSGLSSLINPASHVVEFAKENYGLNIENLIGGENLTEDIVSFANALDDLEKKQGAVAKQQLITKMFGKYQFARMNALFQNINKSDSQASRVIDMKMNVSDVELAGAAKEELDTLMESPAKKFDVALARMQAALAEVGEPFLVFFSMALDIASWIMEKFNSLPDVAKNFVGVLAGLVGIIAPIGIMLTGVAANFVGNMLSGFNKVRRHMDAWKMSQDWRTSGVVDSGTGEGF